MTDEAIHQVYEAFNKGVRWRTFRGVVNAELEDYAGSQLDYYYAEDNLYVIRDKESMQYFFIEARSPELALANFRDFYTRAVESAMEY